MITELQSHLDKSINHLKSKMSALQAGKASVNMVDEIQVENYGSMMPLKSVANVSCPDIKTIKIEPWDKNSISNIQKAILESDLGINPQNMGTHIFLPVPPMTEDLRKKLVKIVKEEEESAKISIRNVRHDFLKQVKTQKDENKISEDEQKNLEKNIQEKIDAANKIIEDVAKNKEKDIMTI
jgi:ribosome recycling factor